jgi:predicted nucleic acid-binding protein
MKKVFIDTSVLVSIFEEDDGRHEEAIRLFEKAMAQKLRVVISDYIFDECITTVNSRSDHNTAVKAGEFILSSNVIELIWLDQEMKLKAWEYFIAHADKGYSFTDCTSFILMKEMKLTQYLAFDKHFERAGFSSFSNKDSPR